MMRKCVFYVNLHFAYSYWCDLDCTTQSANWSLNLKSAASLNQTSANVLFLQQVKARIDTNVIWPLIHCSYFGQRQFA